MKNITKLVAVATFAFSLLLVGAGDRTFKGTLKCAKCALKKTETCQAALEITRGGVTRVILLKNDDVTKAFHKEICKADVFAAVTGKLEGKGKARILVASKIEKAKKKK